MGSRILPCHWATCSMDEPEHIEEGRTEADEEAARREAMRRAVGTAATFSTVLFVAGIVAFQIARYHVPHLLWTLPGGIVWVAFMPGFGALIWGTLTFLSFITGFGAALDSRFEDAEAGQRPMWAFPAAWLDGATLTNILALLMWWSVIGAVFVYVVIRSHRG